MNDFEFGIATLDDIRELGKSLDSLSKSLPTGYAVDPQQMFDMAVSRREDIDSTLTYLTEQESVSTFWKATTKIKAKSTVIQYNIVESLGGANFFPEGGAPEEYDESLKRELENVRYVGSLGKMSYPAQIVDSTFDTLAEIKKLKTTAIIRAADYKGFFADGNNNPIEWNGVYAQVARKAKNFSAQVIDMKGKKLTPEALNKTGQIIQGNYGNPGNIRGWISPLAYADYAQDILDRKIAVIMGQKITDITSIPQSFGFGETKGSFLTNLHLRYKGQTHIEDLHPKLNKARTAFAPTTTKPAAKLDANTATCTVEALTGSSLAAETYDYCFLAGNMFGVSAGFEVKGVVVNAANKKVTFAFSDNGSLPGQEMLFVEVYRKLSSSTGISDYRYMKTIALSDTTKCDDGTKIPGTTMGFFFDWDPQVYHFRQLLPLMFDPLAKIDDSARWMQKLYGTPLVKNPNKIVIIDNIGTIAN